jgi:hypothetical protein
MQGHFRFRAGAGCALRALLLAICVAWSARASAEEVYYRYVNERGRVVFTNAAEQVPLEQREQGRLDLSKVSLNTEIGNELDRRFEEEHAQLTQSDYCKQVRVAAKRSFLEQLWDDFGPLLVCGGALLLFLLFTPTALRRFGAPVWAKVLMMAIPTLALTGLMTFTMSHTNRTVSDLRRRVQPCAPETFAKLKSDPNPIAKHAELIEQLKRQIATIDAEAGIGTAVRSQGF